MTQDELGVGIGVARLHLLTTGPSRVFKCSWELTEAFRNFFDLMSSSTLDSVCATFFSPALDLLVDCQNVRTCVQLPDAAWIRFGIDRVLQEILSGRAYLQQHGYRIDHCPPLSNYFESLKSKRRLSLLSELNERWIQKFSATLADPLAQYSELAEFDLYAGDGHWHSAAAHDGPQGDTKRAVGHCYSLDLRRHTLRHLDLAQGKKEHDIHLLKRQEAQKLRQGAPKGRKVLYAWDKASIDFHAWHRWKMVSGIYFVSLEKSNMKLLVTGLPEWDRNDPVNASVISVEWVAGIAGVMIRRIRYRRPDTGEILSFLTSEMTLRPGLIVFLYKLRWDLEKVFDQLKNKLGEKQAWASTVTAKTIQAQFICLTHNLLLLVERRLLEDGITNNAELERKAKELASALDFAAKAGRTIPTPVVALQRFTQRSVKLLRWLKVQSPRSTLLARRYTSTHPPLRLSLTPFLGHRSWREKVTGSK